MKKIIYSLAVLMMGLSFTACSSDSDDNGNQGGSGNFNIIRTTPLVDQDSYTPTTAASSYSDKKYGNAAMDGCEDLGTNLVASNTVLGMAKFTTAQEEYLYKTLENLVNNVIVPTYTNLANHAEKLESTLNGLTVTTITQAQINSACADFKEARKYWERSEAFLGGAASDFDIDPTIDSWPLNRALLLAYFNNGMSEEMLEDATILGFHALEFILFRDGQPRKVAELQGYDTYKNFEKITGAQELKYAQIICKLLKERTFQLQVSWEGETSANASRISVVKNARLDYVTQNGLSYGQNLKEAGKNSKSTFKTLTAAISQVLSDDEGSAFAICNEVGTAKIANPFATGDISYVESPYSYNSITDFADNIRSIRNVWLGSTDKTANDYSFHTFFASVEEDEINKTVEQSYVDAIAAISTMPTPFVKYCSTLWGIPFEDAENWGEE